MNPNLEAQIKDFDGIAISILAEARADCRGKQDYFDHLISLCFDPRANFSDGATWILKAEVEDQVQLAPEFVDRIVSALDDLQSWQAQLHICQSIEGLHLTLAQADRFVVWATPLMAHSRPFVRAWSLHATVTLGCRFAKHKEGAAHALQVAEMDRVASVRARARALRKLLSRDG